MRATPKRPVLNENSLADVFANILAKEGLSSLGEPYSSGVFKAMRKAYNLGKRISKQQGVGREATNQQLCDANTALVQALDRVHDVISGDEYMENADIGIHEIINNAITLHNLTPNA